MSIDLDIRAAIRHPDLGRVVQAVVDADAHDEADWIEWKSDPDLSTKRGCFSIARTILGMANRVPAAANLVCEGLGYIVVGAEPGNLAGVVSVDPADLDQILAPWLGGVEGPRYTPTYVLIDGRKVLVVVVEAPKNGDPIYALRKESEGGRDGDVFVRKSGRTERANSADLKALMERAAADNAATPDLDVSLVGSIPLSWFDPTTIDTTVAAWVADRRRAMESAARTEERRRHPETTPVPDGNFETRVSLMAEYSRQREDLQRLAREASRLASIAGLAAEPDKRTLDEFLAEVETWGERATDAGPDVVLDRYLRAGHGLVAVRVHNPTGRYLPKVRVEVHFEWDRVCAAERDYPAPRLPAEPRPYGEPTPSALAQSLPYPPSFLASLAPSFDRTPMPPRSWTEEGSVRIVFDVGDLRQEETDTSLEHYLFLAERPPDGTLHGTWKATGPDIDGVIRGTLEVPIRDDPVKLRELLDQDPMDDDDDT
ncbi:MAG: hypothetical protein QOF60_661 [Actinomycetota bacterium]|jgi:hypothetical protein|nr:hypothetical protein [Acidimicrobiaceae bacterium]MEA3075753.1 hypothetical protein [Actinomycetota bacterium]